MTVVTIKQAAENLESLIAEAARGGEVVITGGDGRAFRLVPSEAAPKKKRGFIGSGKGWFVMREDFDAPIEDFEEYMY